MLAVDSNLVVRLLTNDEPVQAKRAAAAFAANEVYIAKSVLLETEWVLRFSYRLDRAAILRGLSALLGMAAVTAEDSVRVTAALDWYQAGMDFADALHLASSIGNAQRFGTFDAKMARRARAITPIEVAVI